MKTSDINPFLLSCDEVIVDISMLYDVAANDEAFVKLMAETFLKTVPQSLTIIASSFESEDYDALYQAAHKAKSSFSIVKINGVLQCLKEIEEHAKQKTKNDVLAKLIDALNAKFVIACKLLKEKFQVE